MLLHTTAAPTYLGWGPCCDRFLAYAAKAVNESIEMQWQRGSSIGGGDDGALSALADEPFPQFRVEMREEIAQ